MLVQYITQQKVVIVTALILNVSKNVLMQRNKIKHFLSSDTDRVHSVIVSPANDVIHLRFPEKVVIVTALIPNVSKNV